MNKIHEFIMDVFNGLINAEKSLRIVCVFFMMMLSLYWIQNLIGTTWNWMAFIAPSLDWILEASNDILPFSFDFGGKAFEAKYFCAAIIIFVIILILKLISLIIEFARDFYEEMYFKYKKAKEDLFNESLKTLLELKERKTKNYALYIQTGLSKKYLQKSMMIDIHEQNHLMNNFIEERTKVTGTEYKQGFLYKFNNFDKIDNVIDILYRIINSPAPLRYMICIQAGDNMEQLDKLISLQEWGRIVIAADTLYRYMCNEVHRYPTKPLGIFQKDEEPNTLELHEIIEE